MTTVPSRALLRPARDELREGWPVVLACFLVAVLSWGFGFYGQAVYLAALQRTNGWSAALISSATTAYYLVGAVLLAFIHAVMARLGPRIVLTAGAFVLVTGAAILGSASKLWQLYLGSLVMSAGWASTSSTAITTTLALFFERRRGLAISLALNGASASGFTVAPALVGLSGRYGLIGAVITTAAVMLAIVLPAIAIGVPRPAETPPRGGSVVDAATMGRSAALCQWRFWTVAAPFALALAAQVGFLVHQVAFLLPVLGRTITGAAVAAGSVAAVIGRIGLGLAIHRLDRRVASAASFVSQAAALAMMLLLTDTPSALVLACILFGLSVGNVITLPALIIQQEFSASAFAMVLGLSTAIGQFTFAFAPAILGLVRDLAGGYRPVLILCIGFELAGGAILVWGRAGR